MRLRLLSFLTLILFTPVLRAAELSPDVKQALTPVWNNFHKIKTIQGKIKRNISLGETEEKSEGFFVQEVPYKVSLEYTTPPRQQIVSDGKTLWIHNVERKEVVRLDSLTADELATMQRFDFYYLLDELTTSPSYEVVIYNKEKGDVVLSVTPKNSNPYISKILVKVTPATGAILAYETFAPDNKLTNQIKLENYRQYEEGIYYPQKVVVSSLVGPEQLMVQTAELTRIELNQPLQENSFSFKPPKGSTIIDRNGLQARLKKQ